MLHSGERVDAAASQPGRSLDSATPRVCGGERSGQWPPKEGTEVVSVQFKFF